MSVITHPLPFRLRVQKALAATLETVKQRDHDGNLIDSDFTGLVFRGRDAFGDSDPVPMMCILEPPLPIEQVNGSDRNPASVGDWDLMIQGFVANDEDNPTDPAHILMADVKAVLAAEKARKIPQSAGAPNPFGMGVPQVENGKSLGNVVTQIVAIGPGVVRPPEIGVSNKAYFWLTLTLKISEDISRPFV